tara:strand:- start:960 stop:3209 length:2250 start_codon:yes stop_codon:yes gene_type:complete
MFKKLNILFYFLFLQLFIITCSYSNDQVSEINISGNERVSSETIKMFSGINLEDKIGVNEIDQILKEIYKSNFFDNVNVKFKNNILSIQVVEKPVIENITYNGKMKSSIEDEIIKLTALKSRSSYDKNTLEKDKIKILNILKEFGFYFAKVEINVENLEKNKVNIIYDIDVGDKSKIKKISFVGNKLYKDKKLKNIIVSEEYKFWKFISGRKFLNENIINLDKRLLKNFYLNKGFYQVKINSSFAKFVGDNQFELIYNIDPGNKFYFDKINFSLSNDYDENNFSHLINFFEKLKNKPYSINSVNEIIKKIENIALSEQFESVKVVPVQNIISNKINLTFNIEDTEKFYVEKINIFGNNVTQENVIRNQFEIDEGDPYNEILYNKTVNNIKGLGFFNVAEGQINAGSDPTSKVINITVEEKATGEISLGAGAGTSGATISFGVKENNFLGKGINLDAFTTITEETLKGKFSVRNPNFRNSDKSINASIEAIEIDRSTEFGYKTSKTGFTFGTDFELYDDLDLGLGLSNFYESITTDANASILQKTQEGNYWDSFLKLDFNYDKRNQKFQPTSGFRSFYGIDLPIISDTNTLINSYTYSYYTKLFDENVTTTSVYLSSANSISGDNVKLSERLFVPGRKLRGFERGKIGPRDGEDYIGGNFVTSANLTSTLPQILNNLQNVDFVMFFDAANIWGVDYDSSLDDGSKLRSSVGFGVDWLTAVGPLTFTLAQPLTKASTDKTETFRFNIGTSF